MTTWHLAAEGDAPEGTHRDLADRVGQLLAEGGFGTVASHFSGADINGPVHQSAPAAAPEPDPAASPQDTGGEL